MPCASVAPVFLCCWEVVMEVSGMMDFAIGANVDTGVPRDVGEAGCCMTVLDNLATQDESCGRALDASGVVDHGCHASRDQREDATAGTGMLMRSLSQ